MRHTCRFLILVLAFSLFSSNKGLSQWVQTNGPYGGQIHCFAVSGTNLYVGAYGNGIFLSTDDGASWKSISTGFNSTNALAAIGSNLFAGIENEYGVFISIDSGTTWKAVNTPYGLMVNSFVYSLAISGSTLFAAANNGKIFRSTDSGVTWTGSNTGLTNSDVTALTVSGPNILSSISIN